MDEEQGIAMAHGLFDALGRGDREAVLAAVTDDAVVWQNHDDREKAFSDRIDGLMRASRVSTGFRYVERRYLALPDGVLLQHRLQGTVPDRGAFDAPIIVRAFLRDGRLSRFEEYFDQKALDPLYAAMATARDRI